MSMLCTTNPSEVAGPSTAANNQYSNAETEAMKAELLSTYSKLHNKDRNHKRKPVKWLDFEKKAYEYLEKKKALVEADNSNTIDVNSKCSKTEGAEVEVTDVGETPDQAAIKQLDDPHNHLTVPDENDPEAKQQNDAYLQIVVKQMNSFTEGKKDLHHKLKEVAKKIESFGAKCSKALGLGLPMVTCVPFSDADPCWMKAPIIAMDRLFTDRAKFYITPKDADNVNNNNYTYPLPEEESGPMRVCIVGDLGTNDKIHINTLKAIKALKPDIVLHLGDIYICGTIEECEEFWRIYEEVFSDRNSRPPLFSIPGNHEYIDAGCGYFSELINKQRLGYPAAAAAAAPDRRPQSASYFELLSSKYNLQILGLDTGYNSKNFTLPFGGEQMDYSTSLHPEEAKWSQTRLRAAKEKGMNTIVLTHHQYFSAFWKLKHKNTILGEQILSAEQPIAAWLWGHEHKIGMYDTLSMPEVRLGACLGHGSMPEMGNEVYAQSDSVHKFNPTFTPDSERVYRNFGGIYYSGFAMLEVHDSTNIEMICYQVSRRAGNCTEKGRKRIV